MIVKTITCHNVYNYGATLQEYALFRYLKDLGYDTEVINYQPSYLKKNFSFFNTPDHILKKSSLLKFPYIITKVPERVNNFRRKKSFDLFAKKHIDVTFKEYSSNSEIKTFLPIADIYICGSDQIWNCLFENGRDPAFYLDFAPKSSLKIAYAASFATDTIPEDCKVFVKKMVSFLDYVSVREASAVRILNEVGFDNIENVLDPVFLIDKSKWMSFVTDIEEDYIFVYDFDSNEFIYNESIRLSKELGLKIYTVNSNIKYSNKNFYTKGPEEFLSLIKNAALVLTNSFHAVAFSLIFHTPMLVFNRKEQINTRMRDLLECFDLSHLLIVDGKIPVDTNIDFKEVDNLKNKLVLKSKNFLTEALSRRDKND